MRAASIKCPFLPWPRGRKGGRRRVVHQELLEVGREKARAREAARQRQRARQRAQRLCLAAAHACAQRARQRQQLRVELYPARLRRVAVDGVEDKAPAWRAACTGSSFPSMPLSQTLYPHFFRPGAQPGAQHASIPAPHIWKHKAICSSLAQSMHGIAHVRLSSNAPHAQSPGRDMVAHKQN